MSAIVQQTMTMVNMLPYDDQAFVYEFVKKLVRAWDPDFSKLTPAELKRVTEAEERMLSGEYFTDDEIDWD